MITLQFSFEIALLILGQTYFSYPVEIFITFWEIIDKNEILCAVKNREKYSCSKIVIFFCVWWHVLHALGEDGFAS